MARVMRFLQAAEGVTSIEYALIASLIAMAIVAGVTSLGTAVETNYTDIATNVTEALD
ncbi:MAG: Flp family type IVb pilin [Desulfuromonadales bacterium]|nr:Flp family type IVb pilin [Desulfuromonadales bacterium]